MWLHRRSEEPSPTEIACYWVKSKLSKVGTSLKFLTLKDFGALKELSSDEESSDFLKEVIDKGVENQSESQILKHFKKKSNDLKDNLSLHQLMLKYLSSASNEENCEKFFEFCSLTMDDQLCSQALAETTEQSDSSLWFELRYGRITASKIYDAAHCKKSDGVFVNQILGVSKFKPTDAMKRGIALEKSVVKELEKVFKVHFNYVGIKLNPKYPIFGASPDAICDDYVVEIKCPQSERTISNYLTKDNKITAKYKAQVQLQMFMFGKGKCLFCVADPNFENNLKFTHVWEEFDEEYIIFLMDAAKCFWSENIFKHFFNSKRL